MNSYNTLPELLALYNYSKEVLAKITSRRSNNSMFIRQDEVEIKELYQKTTRLYMYISTLETFLECSPLYPKLTCSVTGITAIELETPIEYISDELRDKYKAIYNRLFTCIQLLIGSIPSHLYDNLEYVADDCLVVTNDTDDDNEDPLPCVDAPGDFNLDFSFDFYVGKICNIAPSYGKIIYVGTSSNYAPNEAEILLFPYAQYRTSATGNYTIEAGDHKVFVIPESFVVLGFLDNGSATPVAMDLSYGTVVNANTVFSYYTITINGENYRVYRTLNALANSIVINVE